MKTEHTAQTTKTKKHASADGERSAGRATKEALAKAGVSTERTDAPVAAGAAAGLAAGAIAGAVAGPPGAVIGAVVGGAIGAAAGKALEDKDTEDAVVEEKLDEELGVVSGPRSEPLGAASPETLAAKRSGATRGVISRESAGAQGGDVPPTEGGIPPAESEDT